MGNLTLKCNFLGSIGNFLLKNIEVKIFLFFHYCITGILTKNAFLHFHNSLIPGWTLTIFP